MKPTGSDRLGRPRRLMPGCSEQGKLPAAKAFMLAERDKHMSEQEKPKSFMQELDEWAAVSIVSPLLAVASRPLQDVEAAVEAAKKAIRQKVLETLIPSHLQKQFEAEKSHGKVLEIPPRGTRERAIA